MVSSDRGMRLPSGNRIVRERSTNRKTCTRKTSALGDDREAGADAALTTPAAQTTVARANHPARRHSLTDLIGIRVCRLLKGGAPELADAFLGAPRRPDRCDRVANSLWLGA